MSLPASPFSNVPILAPPDLLPHDTCLARPSGESGRKWFQKPSNGRRAVVLFPETGRGGGDPPIGPEPFTA